MAKISSLVITFLSLLIAAPVISANQSEIDIWNALLKPKYFGDTEIIEGKAVKKKNGYKIVIDGCAGGGLDGTVTLKPGQRRVLNLSGGRGTELGITQLLFGQTQLALRGPDRSGG